MDRSVQYGVVVVVHRDGRYLMIRRGPGVIVPGAWCFVGGAIEPGESEADAVVREFREEVGGHVRPVRRIWEYTRPDGLLHLYWWQATLNPGELRANPAEVSELKWCTPDEVLTLPDLLDSNRMFMAELGHRLSQGGLE